MAQQLARGTPLAAMSRHMLGLFQGRPGARSWRRIMTVDAVRPGAGLEVLDRALAALSPTGQALRRAAAFADVEGLPDRIAMNET
jgi:tRNA-dihydrouridine synthase A